MKLLGKLAAGFAVLLLLVAGVGYLVLQRPDIPYEELEARYAVPTSHFLDLPDGVRAHYRDDGDPAAPTVVLVHGFGDSFLSWAPWINILSRNFRVITVDVPGHGLTRAPESWAPTPAAQVEFIDAFATAAKLPAFAIAGNSMGGAIAWRTTLMHPERIRALVLVDAGGFPNEKQAEQPWVFQLLATPVGRWALEHLETRPLTKASLQNTLLNNPLVTDAFVTRWVDVQLAPGHRRILMWTPGGESAGAAFKFTKADPAQLATISVPTLVLWGEKDPLIEVAAARKFGAAIPGAAVITYPNVGHMPQLENPDQSAADVDAFLKRAMVER
ncbi:MAG: alpha/beta hydrolase [Hyphomonadaceae bacterium]